MTETVGTLVLTLEPGGWRHYLCGRAVHCGSGLEIGNGRQWIPVRYECALTKGNTEPIFYALCGRIIPENNAIFRWPL